LLVGLARAGVDGGEVRPEVHHFLADLYGRLAVLHARAGRWRAAERARRCCDAHRALGGDDGPPYAAAMAMPRPGRLMMVHAVSGRRMDDADDAA